jgi:hypothetical protein
MGERLFLRGNFDKSQECDNIEKLIERFWILNVVY